MALAPAEEIHHPHVGLLHPPYTEHDDIQQGLNCYICDTGAYKSWMLLMEHVRRAHGIQHSQLNGTYLHTMASKDIAADARDRRQRNKEAKQAKSTPGGEQGLGQESVAGAERGGEQGDFEAPGSGQQTFWKMGMAFFKTDEHGEIICPMEVVSELPQGGVLLEKPEQASSSGTVHRMPKFVAPTTKAPAPKPPAGIHSHHQSSPAPVADWISTVPKICIKQEYIDHKDVEPSTPGSRAPKWPIQLGEFKIEIPKFEQHLMTEKSQGGGAQGDTMRGLTRFFHMLEMEGSDYSDPAILVSMRISGLHKAIFKLHLMQPGFSWTRKILDALKVFIEWQIDQVGTQHLMSDQKHWLKYKTSLEQLLASLKGGIQKKVYLDKNKRTFDRRLWDATKLENFPPVPIMKASISKAMATLHTIHELYKGHKTLPKEVQAAANSAMVGIFWLNGFGGRKKEIERMLREHCWEQLRNNLDFLLCHDHKTSNTYGSLAKWIAEGTAEAIRIYLSLPCRPEVKTFLVPIKEHQDTISIPAAFKRFCKVYLPKTYTWPTVNLMRKWYHTELSKQTRTEDKFLQLMRSVDGHSPNVARRHYVLQTPADDARLAKALVHAMIGKPVPWPSDSELKKLRNKSPELPQILEGNALALGEGDDSDEEDVDEQDMGWWEFAERFGIPKPLLAIEDDLNMEASIPEPMLAISDSLVGTESLQADNVKEQKQKKGKKEKKEKKGQKDKSAKKDKKEKKETQEQKHGGQQGEKKHADDNASEGDESEEGCKRKKHVKGEASPPDQEAAASSADTARLKFRRKISPDLETWILKQSLQANSMQAMPPSWFLGLREKAISEGMMDDFTASAEGMRNIVRDYFKHIATPEWLMLQ